MNKYVLFDLEATCCNDGSMPKHKTEIIEIGAICIDDNLNVLGKFVTFVKPIEYPKLHNFCTELKSITQSDVDSAEPLSSVVVDFKIWLDSFNPVWCGAWGFFDRDIFLKLPLTLLLWHHDCRY